MRLRAQSFASLVVPACALALSACSDDPPIYPPIVINIINGGGVVGAGASSSTGDTSSVGDQSSGGGSTNAGNGNGNGTSGGSTTPGGLLAHCSAFNSATPPAPKTQCDLDHMTDGGAVSGDITADRTLTSGHSYTLKGIVRVMQGKTLTIEPCVKIMGEDSKAVLVVLSSAAGNPANGCHLTAADKMTPGGKLVAVGEPMAPIIFTSSKPAGQRAASDWGGVLLLGNARTNLATKTQRPLAEGLIKSECYGYYTDEFNAESSGHLEYVRIEYASQTASLSSETNGLTLAGLGSGTEIHYVEVSNSGDDCFEWFGGTVNADHLIALNCDDDMFDIDNGYAGHLQHLFGREATISHEDNSRGFEITSSASGGLLPLTAGQASNVTFCGSGTKVIAGNERGGISVEQSPDMHIMNMFLTGFTSKGGEFYGVRTTDSFKLDTTHIFKQENPFQAAAAKTAFGAGMTNTCDNDSCGTTKAVPDRFCDCWANPPAPVSATIPSGLKPTGFQDEAASQVGAFKDATPDGNWMRGLWVDWSDN
jgi:hypothetical protein